MVHKKLIRRAVKKLHTFEKRLDREKHSEPKKYEKNEDRLKPVVKDIMKL